MTGMKGFTSSTWHGMARGLGQSRVSLDDKPWTRNGKCEIVTALHEIHGSLKSLSPQQVLI